MTDKTKGLRAYQARRMAEKLAKPVGLTYDVLHEIRKAMRALRRAEEWLKLEHRRVKRKPGGRSNEWEEAKRIRDEEGSAP